MCSNYGFTPGRVRQVLELLANAGIKTIDTAQGYWDSEVIIGEAANASLGFTIDTKVSYGLLPAIDMTKENVIKAGQQSLKNLDIDMIDVYYIHAPDRKVPLKDTLDGINELYEGGVFKRFGLSNFKPEEVVEVVDIAKANKFVLPSVYQGNYNAVGRRVEKELFPILRKYNMSFYAYSPIAGGFLAKRPEDITVNPKGRFANRFYEKMYNSIYNRPAMLDFLTAFGKIADGEGIAQAELAYRWVTYHSQLKPELGDAIIIGSSHGTQLINTLEWLKKGPLNQKSINDLDDLWEGVKKDAILDNFNDYIYANLDDISDYASADLSV